jgi:release factor glutamine methyltransferase
VRVACEVVRQCEQTLRRHRIPRPRWSAEQLLAHRLGMEPVDLYAERPSVTEAMAQAVGADVAYRSAGMPLSYVIGHTSFFGRTFQVGPGVFVPRPETEFVVEWILHRIAFKGETDPLVVDVGTGCGAIAVTLALERCDWRVVGIDISQYTLAFAIENGKRHGARVRWIQGDLIGSLADATADLIVANLPYLDPQTASQWPRELAWEPWLALDGGEGGLAVMGRLIRDAGRVLRSGGWLVLEIGPGQSPFLIEWASGSSLFAWTVENDLAGLERMLVLRRHFS